MQQFNNPLHNCPNCNKELTKHQIYISTNNVIMSKMEACKMLKCQNCRYHLFVDDMKDGNIKVSKRRFSRITKSIPKIGYALVMICFFAKCKTHQTCPAYSKINTSQNYKQA